MLNLLQNLKSKKMKPYELEELIVNQIKTIYDPEIPVDIYELGLIYEISVNEDYEVVVTMTLTTPNCPSAEEIPREVEEKVSLIEEVKKCDVVLTFDPPWDKDMMSEEAQLELGFL